MNNNFNKHDMIFEKVNNEYEFYYIINITRFYYIVRKIKKKIDYKVDDNERLYKVVNPLIVEGLIILLNCSNPNRIYKKNIDNKFEKYDENKLYIEDV